MAVLKYETVSIEAYEQIEIEDNARYEFINGNLFEMQGGSVNHETIVSNMVAAIRSRIKKKGSGCRAFGSGIKLELKQKIRYVYADVTVFCEPMEESVVFKNAQTNPTVIIEVLSRSTSPHDRGSKGPAYRRMPSVREYIMIAQTIPYIAQYSRKDQYPMFSHREFFSLEDVLVIPSLDQSIPLKEIYEDVVFPYPDDVLPASDNMVYEPLTMYE